MRILYLCLGYCLAPLLIAAMLWRGFAERGWWRGLGERFGRGPALPLGALWLHAASVGEVQAAAPLVEALRARYPERALLLTTVTPAGRARAASLYGSQLTLGYLPLDLPGAVERFLQRCQPRLLIVLETELWPTLYRGCRLRGVPVLLASARVSARSARRYRAFPGLTRAALAGVTIAAQSEADAERFRALGAEPGRVTVAGNLKFEQRLAPAVETEGAALRAALGAGRPVWVAGSTHAGEEEQLLAAHRRLRRERPGALLVLVPRHPARFAAVAAWLARAGVVAARRSSGAPVTSDTEVLLVDTLGELPRFYAAGDVAFVGGSLVPVGGHNLLEPAALGRAILSGPHCHAAVGIAAPLLAAGALTVVPGATELAARLDAYVGDPAARARAGAAGRAVVAANRGALARLLAQVDAELAPAAARAGVSAPPPAGRASR